MGVQLVQCQLADLSHTQCIPAMVDGQACELGRCVLHQWQARNILHCLSYLSPARLLPPLAAPPCRSTRQATDAPARPLSRPPRVPGHPQHQGQGRVCRCQRLLAAANGKCATHRAVSRPHCLRLGLTVGNCRAIGRAKVQDCNVSTGQQQCKRAY